MLNGNLITISIGEELVSSTGEVGLSFNNSVVDVTKSNSDTWRQVITGSRDYEISFSGLGMARKRPVSTHQH